MTSRRLSKHFSQIVVAPLLAISGATGLAYEVLWARDFALVFGATAVGSAVVLAATFAGLALGAYVGGRLAQRVETRPSRQRNTPASRGRSSGATSAVTASIATTSVRAPSAVTADESELASPDPAFGLRLYARLEAALALAIFAYVAVRPGLGGVAAALASWSPPVLLPLLQTAFAAVVLVVPTALLGATLPAAGTVLAAGDASGAARFYACNALGGALGAILCVTLALPTLGTRGTYLFCAGLDLVLAAVAVVAAAAGKRTNARAPLATDRQASAHRDPEEAISSGSSPRHALALVLTATSGFIGLACEVLWLRGLSGVLSNSVYSFALMLAAVLVGIVLGAAIAAPLLRNARALASRLAWTASLLALAIVGSGTALRFVATLSLSLASRFGMHSPRVGFAVEASLGVLVILPAATALGALFALALALAEAGAPTRRFGGVLAANTAGAVAGSLTAAFVMLPRLGLGTSLLATSALAAVLALLAARPRSARAAAPAVVAALGVAAAALAPPLDVRWRDQGAEQILFERQGAAATVLVTADARGQKRLRVNGQYSLGGTSGLLLERRQALLPLLLHPDPRRVLVIGVGTGDTLGAAVADPAVEADGVELIPEVLEAAALFAEENRGAMAHPRARLFADDARSHLLAATDRYDVIVSDLFLPWTAGTASLYARELYATGRARLAPGGLYAQWLPLHQLATDDLKSIIATFLDVFPHVQLWVAYHRSDTPLALLVGSDTPVRLDAATRRARLGNADLAAVLRSAGFLDPADVAPLYVASERQLRPAVAVAPIITDDRPGLEFSAPAAYFRQPSLAPEGLDWVASVLDPEPAPVDGAPPATAELRKTLLAAQRALLAGDRPRELKLYAQALSRAPDVRVVRQGLYGIAHDRIAAGDLHTATAIAAGIVRAAPESAEARQAQALVERAGGAPAAGPVGESPRRP